MPKSIWFALAAALVVGCNTNGQGAPIAAGDRWLKLVHTIPLPNVEGRFDHFAADPRGHRLFIAALGNDTLEVIDTDAGTRAGSVTGLHKPTGVAFLPESGQVAVASGDDGTVRFYDRATLKPGPKVEGLDDADNVRYDPAAKRLYVGYGSGALAIIDAEKAQKVADIKLDAHPESFQLEKSGKRIFVNVTQAGHIAVVDRENQTVIAKWPIADAKANFPMALDEPNHRLFVGCRKPANLLVLDTETGKPVAALDIVGDTDDLFYDALNRRIYISGGAGAITVVEQTTPDTYRAIANIRTAPGARTSFFVPESAVLYVAVPHRGSQPAELRVFKAHFGK